MSTEHANTGTELTAPEATSDVYPVIHDPIKGKESPNPLVGTVVGYDTIVTDYGERVLCLIVDDQGTVWSRMVTGAVLESQFKRRKPAPGELVRIQYLGTRVSRSGALKGREYHDWDVRVGRDPQVPDWDALDNGEVRLEALESSTSKLEPGIPVATVEPASVEDEAEGDYDDGPLSF